MMGLSDYTEYDGGDLYTEYDSDLFPPGPYLYADTLEPAYIEPTRVLLSDPVRYYSADGRELVLESAIEQAQPVKDNHQVGLADMKLWAKIDHDYEDDLLQDLIEAAAEAIGKRLNRSYPTVPASINLAIRQTVTHWYFNRGDTGDLPPEANRIVESEKLLPGL